MTTMRGMMLALLAAAFVQSGCGAQGVTTAAERAKLDGKLTGPAGYKVEYFIKGVSQVRFMVLGPDGAVYASQPYQGRVVRLWDVDGDGVADSVRVVIEGQKRPHGLAFHNGWLYIANTDAVVRVKLDARGVAQGTPETLVHLSPGGNHWSRTVVFGPDNAMYVAAGSTCNLCVEKDSDRAVVLRFDENGGKGKVFGRGLRNAVGLAFLPGTNSLWASQNERDNLEPDHKDLPPDELNILRDGGDYGWPYCYSVKGQAIPNPEYHDAARCASTIPAALDLEGHAAALGMTFLTGATQFPADWRGDLLIALHGSWNRDKPTVARVVRVHVKDGKPVSYEDFLTGFQSADGKRWGRPVDPLVYKDGSVLISDDANSAIYRVFK
ncbi:MAG: PQQ-dependent sugar dehydrogenase [Gemmatimonadota bacterium]|nr:PQQ-dependent sugar dehydrogenase [Gemmatimonadota bacterium]